MMVFLVHAAAFLFGSILVGATILSAVRALVLPRAASDGISILVFRNLRRLFRLRMRFASSYTERDRIMAYYAPVALISLLPVWLSILIVAYTAIFWAIGAPSLYTAFRISGSSLLTLGFDSSEGLAFTLLEFSEAALGLMLVALLIAYLPSMYSAFSRRETNVTLLEVRAGSPPSAVEMLARYSRIHGLDRLGEQWQAWEIWFAEVQESHTSLAALVFFRSPSADKSWITAAGAVLDAASLTLSSVETAYDPRAALCIRAGYLCLRQIADFFGADYPKDPHFPEDAITVQRSDFDAVLQRLESDGLPLKSDREQAWMDYGGWRVNYDSVLVRLADITMAPESPWTGPRRLPESFPISFLEGWFRERKR